MTQNHVQGVFGEFVSVIDIAGGTLTSNQVQGVSGYFSPVIDSAQTTSGGPETLVKDIIGSGLIPFAR